VQISTHLLYTCCTQLHNTPTEYQHHKTVIQNACQFRNAPWNWYTKTYYTQLKEMWTSLQQNN